MHKQYLKDGGQLGFKEWIGREKKKDFMNFDGQATVPINQPLTDSIYRTLDQLHRTSGYQDELSNEYWLGMKKTNLLIGTSIVVIAIIAVVAYKKGKK